MTKDLLTLTSLQFWSCGWNVLLICKKCKLFAPLLHNWTHLQPVSSGYLKLAGLCWMNGIMLFWRCMSLTAWMGFRDSPNLSNQKLKIKFDNPSISDVRPNSEVKICHFCYFFFITNNLITLLKAMFNKSQKREFCFKLDIITIINITYVFSESVTLKTIN